MTKPLYDKLHEFNEIARWCTPSIHPELPQVADVYGNEMSISYHDLGNPNKNSGLFGQATALAAEAYQSEHTLFGVNGTTGSNYVVIKALQQQCEGNLRILSSRNIHMSIVNAASDFGVELDFIPPSYDQELQVFRPNTVGEIMDNMQQVKPDVLLVSNPTYEGASVDLVDLVGKVRETFPDTIIYIDEAWGAHFSFSDALPMSAMQAGADICTQSTHKQGNALQQTSMIHWRDGRIDKDILRSSYTSLSTTSPSFHLMAAMDATREFMQERGSAELAKLIEFSEEFRAMIQKIGDVSVVSYDDPTKLLVHVKDKDAAKLARQLEKKRIVVEKAEANNLLLVVGFQNTVKEARKTTKAIQKGVARLPVAAKTMAPFPLIIEKGEITGTTAVVPLQEAIGRTCLEHVVPYPPGIPTLTRGERVTKQHVEYLTAAALNPQIDIMGVEKGQLLVAG